MNQFLKIVKNGSVFIWFATINFFSPSESRKKSSGWTEEYHRKVAIMVPTILASGIATAMITIQYLFEFGINSVSTIGSAIGIFISFAVLFGIKLTGRFFFFVAVYILFSIGIILSSSYNEGPFVTGIIYWLAPGIFFSSYVLAPFFSFIIFVIGVGYIIFTTYLLGIGHVFPVMPHLSQELYNVEVFRSIAIFFLSALIAYYYENVRIRNENSIKKRTEELGQLNTQLRRITEAVESCSEAIALADGAGQHFYQNNAFTKLFGYSVNDIANQSYEVIHTDKGVNKNLEQVVFNGHSWNDEVSLQNKDGIKIWANLNAGPVFDKVGKIISTIRIYLDITEKKKIEQQLFEAIASRRAAENANSLKSEFVANISHEIRTPMHGILSFARYALEDVMDEKVSKEDVCHDINEIIDSANRLTCFLDDLLDISRLETGKTIYEMEENDILDSIYIVMEEMANLAKERGLVFDLQFGKNVITRGFFDPSRIQQVIRNLFSNAIKFSDPNKPIIIDVGNMVQSGLECLQVVISDTGLSVPKNEYKSVFDKFTQSSKSKSGAGGTGLGLSISKQIIMDHNGKIWIESEQSGITKVTFVIPRSPSLISAS